MIALVDDEKNVRMTLKTALKREGFETIEHSNGLEALEAVNSGIQVELYVLDIMMPVMDGITFLRKLREKGISTPVIFLTSRDEEFDKILGLELGADDYLCKPFSMRELIARIHVVLRRTGRKENISADTAAQNLQKLVSGNLMLNLQAYTAEISGKNIELTVTEFRLLEFFLKNQDIVFSREQLLQACYPEDTFLNDRAIDCHIKRLRKKLSSDVTLEKKIQTIYGAGYKYVSLI